MEERLRQRLVELRADFADGRRRLEELEGQARDVQQALLRISGAIQVLEEELARVDGKSPGSPAAPHCEPALTPGGPGAAVR